MSFEKDALAAGGASRGNSALMRCDEVNLHLAVVARKSLQSRNSQRTPWFNKGRLYSENGR